MLWKNRPYSLSSLCPSFLGHLFSKYASFSVPIGDITFFFKLLTPLLYVFCNAWSSFFLFFLLLNEGKSITNTTDSVMYKTVLSFCKEISANWQVQRRRKSRWLLEILKRDCRDYRGESFKSSWYVWSQRKKLQRSN